MMESRQTFMATPGRTAYLSGRPTVGVNGYPVPVQSVVRTGHLPARRRSVAAADREPFLICRRFAGNCRDLQRVSPRQNGPLG